jgi:hypothetical protein
MMRASCIAVPVQPEGVIESSRIGRIWKSQAEYKPKDICLTRGQWRLSFREVTWSVPQVDRL